MRVPFQAAILLAFALILGSSGCAPRQGVVAPLAASATPTAPGPVAATISQTPKSQDPLSMLTPDERRQVQAKLAEMQAKGEKPPAAPATETKNLASEGAPPRVAGNPAHAWDRLTPRQQQRVKTTVQMMFEQGAKPEEVKATVAAMLRQWGAIGSTGSPRGAHGPVATKSPVTSAVQNQAPWPVKATAGAASERKSRPTLTQTVPGGAHQP